MTKPSSTVDGSNVTDEIIRSLTIQRDHWLEIAREKDAEIEQLQTRLEKSQEAVAAGEQQIERLHNDIQELTCGDPRLVSSAVKSSTVRDSIAPNMHCPVCGGWFWTDKFNGHKCQPVRT